MVNANKIKNHASNASHGLRMSSPDRAETMVVSSMASSMKKVAIPAFADSGRGGVSGSVSDTIFCLFLSSSINGNTMVMSDISAVSL